MIESIPASPPLNGSKINQNKIKVLKFIHPFSIHTSSIQGHGGAGAHLHRGSRASWCLSPPERQGIPWTGPIAGQHRDTQDKQPCTHPFTPKDNLERPVNLTVCFCTVGGS
ncbi:hypothetical protein AMECASPLE_017952 [Ameca splendens]|uniref:Uncharacterized protein n=1 Tax=Ameca splendens TaxID=208324 RepID=A0ABV0YDP1_9TELE